MSRQVGIRVKNGGSSLANFGISLAQIAPINHYVFGMSRQVGIRGKKRKWELFGQVLHFSGPDCADLPLRDRITRQAKTRRKNGDKPPTASGIFPTCTVPIWRCGVGVSRQLEIRQIHKDKSPICVWHFSGPDCAD